MSGVAVAWYLLKTNAAVISVIPASRIKAGDLSRDTALPAISIMQVSSVPRLTVAMTETPLHAERVQVSWLFKAADSTPAGTGYPGMDAMDRLVLAALPNTRGAVNGVTVDSILPAEGGPDLPTDEVGIIQGSRDFIVKFTQ